MILVFLKHFLNSPQDTWSTESSVLPVFEAKVREGNHFQMQTELGS